MKFNLKMNHLFFFVCASLLLASCSSDDTQSEGNNAEIIEARAIESKTVFDNLVVEGATKETGAPQTPNEAISFTLNKENTSALIADGFDIEFSSPNSVSGIYLQIKDVEGNLADGYYDIPVSQNGLKNARIHESKRRGFLKTRKNAIHKKATNDDTSIDVDFTSIIEPGTFCYIVCVYDDEGNISAPQEVCVTVESWAGNDDLVGMWNYTKTEVTYDGITETINVGEEDCVEESLFCDNQEILEFTNCDTLDSFKLTLNSNGTYSYEVLGSYKDIDYAASISSCQLVSSVSEESYSASGNWAYDKDSGNLILVELEYTETEEGVTDAETYDIGDAYVIELKVDLNGNNLTLADEDPVETLKFFFTK